MAAAKTARGRELLEALFQVHDAKSRAARARAPVTSPTRAWAAARLCLNPQNMAQPLCPRTAEEAGKAAAVSYALGDLVVIALGGPGGGEQLARVADTALGPDEVAVAVYGGEFLVVHMLALRRADAPAAAAVEGGAATAQSTSTWAAHSGTAEPKFSPELLVGDVVLVHGLCSEAGSWMNGREGLVTAVAAGSPARLAVDVAGVEGGTLTQRSVKGTNLEILYRVHRDHAPPPLPPGSLLKKYKCANEPTDGATILLPTQCDAERASENILGLGAGEHPLEPAWATCTTSVETGAGTRRWHAMADTALLALRTFRFHADAYTQLGACFANGPPGMR